MGRILSTVVWAVVAAVVLTGATVVIGLSLPALTKDPSAAAGTAAMALIACPIGLVVGGIFGYRRAK